MRNRLGLFALEDEEARKSVMGVGVLGWSSSAN